MCSLAHEFLLCYLGSDSYLHRLRVSSGVHKLYGVTFLRTEGEGRKQSCLACPLGGGAPLNREEGSPRIFTLEAFHSQTLLLLLLHSLQKTQGLRQESLKGKERREKILQGFPPLSLSFKSSLFWP